ncbi:hypothetical protein [Burkholderia sp. AU16741]|uniref:hypothetical protein n=1 Tax=Burkholderia sp. AU16741 TaxID=2015347 RepID=UPI00117D6AA1|nr:hypothetical protein [Burkholderia sp. AU16741]
MIFFLVCDRLSFVAHGVLHASPDGGTRDPAHEAASRPPPVGSFSHAGCRVPHACVRHAGRVSIRLAGADQVRVGLARSVRGVAADPGGSLYVVVPGRSVAGNAQDAHDARMVESLVHVQPFAHMPA